MNLFQNSYFDNSFLYPTQAFLVLVSLYMILIAIGTAIIVWVIRKRGKVVSTISKEPVFSLLITMLIVVGSRISIMFFNSSHVQILPEKMFAMDMVGRDWLDGVMQPMMRLWKGVPFNPQTGYGQGLTVFIGILLYPFYAGKIITQQTVVHFSQISYLYLASLVLLTYLSLIITKYKDYIRNVLLIAFMTFLLGFSGSLGLERGNTDILFSLVVVMLYFVRVGKHGYSAITVCIEACILGMVTASKMTMLPIALAFIFSSKHLLPSILYFLLSYGAWSLAPGLFGIKSTLLDSYSASSVFQKSFFSNMLSVSCWPGSHVLRGVAANFILCSQVAMEELRTVFTTILHVVFYLLVGLVFIVPLTPLVSRLNQIVRVWTSPHRSTFLLLFLALSVASINLLPVFSFSYRLYYSFALLLAAWHSITNVQAKQILVCSTIFLLLKGMWFTDWKFLNILVALHYMSILYAIALQLRTTLGFRKDLYAHKKK